MKIYAALWNDRHSDPGVYLFSTAELAMTWAKKTCREYNRFGGLEESEGESDCLYIGTYSCEGDGITVTECEVDAEQ